MDTLIEEPATSGAVTDTQTTDETEESVNDDTSTDGTQEDAATLRKRLSDKDKHIVKLETQLREKPKEKTETSELDWRFDNESRLKLVKDEYQQALSELKASGAKETTAIKNAALELAEKRKGITVDTSDVERQAAMSGEPGTLTRMKSNPVQITEYDRRFGITAERKQQLQEKYPDLKEEV